MLSGPRKLSPLDIGEIEKLVKDSLRWAESVLVFFKDILEVHRIFSVYTGIGYIPSLILENTVTYLTGFRNIQALESSYFLYGVAPYSEEDYAFIYYMSSPWERNSAARLAETARLLNIRARYLVVDKEDPVVSERITEDEAIEVPGGDLAYAYESVLSVLLGVSFTEKTLNKATRRTERIKEEIKTLPQSVGEIKEHFHVLEEKILSATRPLLFLYTPVMKAGAHALWYKFSMYLGEQPMLYPLAMYHFLSRILSETNTVVILYSGVEEQDVKEARFSFSRKGINVIDLAFRTDPVTAQLYSMIFSFLL